MNENPGVYNEARNRLREQKEQEKKQIEQLFENVEKQKEYTRTVKKFDIFELKHRIETGRSLSVLESDIQQALKEGLISREAFDSMQKSIEILLHNQEKKEKTKNTPIYTEDVPFDDTQLAKFFEEKKIGENVFVDVAGFFYGFFVQGGAIFIILLWRIILDILFLPRDIYDEIKHNIRTQKQ